MGERRIATRQKSFLRGCIYFNNRRASADCLIRDISDVGARLIFSSVVAIPDVVDIYVPQKEQTLRARVQWRHGDEIGVAFEGSAQPAEPMPTEHADVAGRLAKLETEVASLRRLLRKLQAVVPQSSSDAA